MTRSTKFTQHTYDALALFTPQGDIPTRPAGLPLLPQQHMLTPFMRHPKPRRRSLRPTWPAVAMAGIVGVLAGVLIAVLSTPAVGG